MHYRRRDSIFDVFTLNPLPYPVLLILAVLFVFLGMSWFFNYEEMEETVEVQANWVLFVTPVLLLLLVRWLSCIETPDMFYALSPWERRRRTHHLPSEGTSPWVVAAFIVLLLVLVQFQSSFLDSWHV
ncbi:hypothetical protein K2173_017915 [Erythroxylum novogranatense]|uniref:Uncharacterized protein n=1 Tax=Erythroxylum novogranatense TaxID=1862640 RepID=A0AAV8TL18_9ROSI|nr:hypothetical protein K2173_017915 [Erythroxylum novogranatense]